MPFTRKRTQMIDLRIWRLLLIAIPLAGVVAMFSLQHVPKPIQPVIPPDAFERSAATGLARDLATRFSSPTPGSEADSGLADFVEQRFTAIQGAAVSQQRFSSSFDGNDVELRNLIAVLPGSSDRQVALVAGRDVGEGDGAVSAISSTAAMLEIASSFSGANHDKTLVFVSTDGGPIGELGARRFASDYSDAALLDGVVVLSQPASRDRTPPLVISSSTRPENISAQLDQTANEILSSEAKRPAGNESPLRELFRLALPAGLGGQAPLIANGLEAVRVSSAGELPLPPGLDTRDRISPGSLERFGRGALSLMLALDQTPAGLDPGPDTRLGLAGNLLPGWSLALLALAILLAPLVTALEALGRAAGRPEHAAKAVLWVFARALPLIAVVLAVYALAFLNLIADPPFPFYPDLQSPGLGGKIVYALLIAILVGGYAMLRRLAPTLMPPTELVPSAAIVVASAAAVLIWFANPYLALVVSFAPSVWIPAAASSSTRRRLGLIALGLVPLTLAFSDLAHRLGDGPGPAFVWKLLLLQTSGQAPFGLLLLACVIAGAALALARPPRLIAEPPEIRISRRAPAGSDDTSGGSSSPAGAGITGEVDRVPGPTSGGFGGFDASAIEPETTEAPRVPAVPRIPDDGSNPVVRSLRRSGRAWRTRATRALRVRRSRRHHRRAEKDEERKRRRTGVSEVRRQRRRR